MNKYLTRPESLLLLMAASVPLSFAVWMALINNFAIERAAFSGQEIGILQSLREIPGFLAFGVIYILLFIKEQRLAYLSLILLGIGTFITGFFPTTLGLYITTIIMSIGFHYFETLKTSLSLQWFNKDEAPHKMGRIMAVGSFASILVFCFIALTTKVLNLDYIWIYIIGGGITISLATFCWFVFPHFPEKVTQHKKIILRKRYWLYYALVLMGGARRQIFVVFASFLMVEKFNYSITSIAILFLVNAVLNMLFAPKIGKLIGRFGERNALVFEYIGLILIFTSYAFVDDHRIAAGLYIADHFFFALAIAIKTYFQKIADPKDISSTAAVSFSINHIAAVIIPVIFGLIWLQSPALVFLLGAGMAVVSLFLALVIPRHPTPDNVSSFRNITTQKIVPDNN